MRGLVEQHGGAVTAHSAGDGRGSEFVVRLPLTASGGCCGAPGACDERTAADAGAPESPPGT